jgi:NhaP-type Na+/H+ or K+/H+ antiporter
VLEVIMFGVVVTIAISVFLGGVMVGVLAVMAVAIRREDRRHTLVGEAPDRLSRNARRLTGMARRDLDTEFLRPAGELVR